MNEVRRPKYSILIPTRNGLRYLPYAIESVLSQSSEDFELIVSDNHSSDGTADYLSQLTDPRLSKIRPEAELAMTAHFEFIVAHAKGEWVTIVGDDDGLMPFFFDYLASLKLDSIKAPAIVFRRAYYFWEGCEELYGDNVVSYNLSARTSYVHNTKALFFSLCSISDYTQMPQLYTTGLVRNSYIKHIKNRSGGRFFCSTSPDAASAAILAIHAERHFRVEQPLFWTGTSPKSVGYSNASASQKERVTEFCEQNSSSGLKLSPHIPKQIHAIVDFSVFLYDALLSCPHLPRLWSSRLVRNFFIAGLIVNHSQLKKSILDAYASETDAATIDRFILIVKALKAIDKRKANHADRGQSKPSLNSTDRARFRTMKQASDAVMELHTNNPKKQT